MSKPTEPGFYRYGDTIIKLLGMGSVAWMGTDDHSEWDDMDEDKLGERIPDNEELKRLKELDGIVSTVRSVDEARLDVADVQTRTTTGNQQGEQS